MAFTTEPVQCTCSSCSRIMDALAFDTATPGVVAPTGSDIQFEGELVPAPRLTAVSPESGNEFTDSLINNGRHYVNSLDGSVPGPFVINYFFDRLDGPVNPETGRGTPYDWRPFETRAWQQAIQGWSNVANVTFKQVFTREEALFRERLQDQVTAGGTVSASHSLPNASLTAQSLGTYNFEAVNVRQWTPDQIEPGGNFYRTFIHEVGHGLGLKHPHDSGSGAFTPNYFPGVNPADTSAERQRSLGLLNLNHMFGSVMSYIHGYEFDAQGRIVEVPTRQRPVAGDFFLDHGFAATPMAYDIAATQYLYGANTTFRTGDNVYILPDSNDPRPFVRGAPNEAGVPESIIYQPDAAYWESIWDAGGVDEMRYDGARNAILDLTAATLDATITSRGVLSYAAFIGGGYTIANGVVIENATGGQGSDTIVGNLAANVLAGRGGNDIISGGGGADTLTGGTGADVFRGAAADLDRDTITDFGPTDQILLVGGTMTSAVLSNNVLTFISDGVTRTLNVGGLAGRTAPLRLSYAGGNTTLQFSSDQGLFGAVVTNITSLGGQVYALYDALLGRRPDALGLEFWTSALRSGQSLRDLSNAVLNSAEGQAKFGGLDDAAFVGTLYQAVLGRPGDAGGVASWLGALTGGLSRADVALSFALSNENVAGFARGLSEGVFVTDFQAAGVARLYYGLLERTPDAAGLASFTQAVRDGASFEGVAQGLITSAEYQSSLGGLSNADFVRSLFENALGRTDPAGEASWVSALASGASLAAVAVGIANGAEAHQYLAQQIEGYHFVA